MSEDYAFTHTSGGVFIEGQRANWGDIIWNIALDEIPFLQDIKRNNDYANTEHKWFYENLSARDSSNGVSRVQGGNPNESTTPRYGAINYNTIYEKSVFISRTQQKQLKSGVSDEINRQATIHMTAIRQSFEQACLCRVKKRAPVENSTAGLMHGIPGILGLYADHFAHVDGTRKYGTDNTVNIEIGYPSFNDTTYTGVFAAFKTMIKNLKKLGSSVTHIWCGPDDKEQVSRTWNISNVQREMKEQAKLVELIEMVLTDFGTVLFIPVFAIEKFTAVAGETYDKETGTIMVTDFAVLGNPKYFEVQVFDDFFTEPYADKRDGITRRVLFEGTFEASVPHGTGLFDFAGYASHSNARGLPTTAGAYVLS